MRKRGSASNLLSVTVFGYKYALRNYLFLWMRKLHCRKFFVASVFITCYRVPSWCHENELKQCMFRCLLSKVFGISPAVFLCLKVEKVTSSFPHELLIFLIAVGKIKSSARLWFLSGL